MQTDKNTKVGGVEVMKKVMTVDEIKKSDPRLFLSVVANYNPSSKTLTADVLTLVRPVSLKEKIAICHQLSTQPEYNDKMTAIKGVQLHKTSQDKFFITNEISGKLGNAMAFLEAIQGAMVNKGIKGGVFFPASPSINKTSTYSYGACDKSGTIERMDSIGDSGVSNIRFLEDKAGAIFSKGKEIGCISFGDFDQKDWSRFANKLMSFDAPIGYIGRIKNNVAYLTTSNGKHNQSFQISLDSSTKKEIVFKEEGFVPQAVTAIENGLLAAFGLKQGNPHLWIGESASAAA